MVRVVITKTLTKHVMMFVFYNMRCENRLWNPTIVQKKQLPLSNVSLSKVHNWSVGGTLKSQVTIAGLGNDVL